MPEASCEGATLEPLRAALIAALERHLLVYGAGGEKEARRLIAEIADEVLKEMGEEDPGAAVPEG